MIKKEQKNQNKSRKFVLCNKERIGKSEEHQRTKELVHTDFSHSFILQTPVTSDSFRPDVLSAKVTKSDLLSGML